uniref:Uncharacterized protein n=1 Tax=Pipistrellus kuhlii TaxID=59472 RepID=A0A7J7UTL4_PIPKU|nr:hypothetical protein mPipKuh1_008732 [Pipistrellus kuhlii]
MSDCPGQSAHHAQVAASHPGEDLGDVFCSENLGLEGGLQGRLIQPFTWTWLSLHTKAVPSTWTQGAYHLLGLPTLSWQDFPKLHQSQSPGDSALLLVLLWEVMRTKQNPAQSRLESSGCSELNPEAEAAWERAGTSSVVCQASTMGDWRGWANHLLTCVS